MLKWRPVYFVFNALGRRKIFPFTHWHSPLVPQGTIAPLLTAVPARAAGLLVIIPSPGASREKIVGQLPSCLLQALNPVQQFIVFVRIVSACCGHRRYLILWGWRDPS